MPRNMTHAPPLETPTSVNVSIGYQETRTEKKLETPSFLYSTLIGTRNSTTLLASVSDYQSFVCAAQNNQTLLLLKEYNRIKLYMRGGTTVLSPAKYKFKQMSPLAGSWGTVVTSTPRKSENNDSTKGGSVSNDQTEPIVAFSKPPPQPPLLGPLVALSLLQTWSHHDGDDN